MGTVSFRREFLIAYACAYICLSCRRFLFFFRRCQTRETFARRQAAVLDRFPRTVALAAVHVSGFRVAFHHTRGDHRRLLRVHHPDDMVQEFRHHDQE